MIVEADRLFRTNLAQRLRIEKCRLLLADEQSAVEEILQKEDVDVALLGLSGLKRQGLMLLKAIKRIRPLTEVIIINNSEQIALSIEGMKLGAFDDFLAPFDMESLIRRIYEASQQKKQKEQKSAGKRCRNAKGWPPE